MSTFSDKVSKAVRHVENSLIVDDFVIRLLAVASRSNMNISKWNQAVKTRLGQKANISWASVDVGDSLAEVLGLTIKGGTSGASKVFDKASEDELHFASLVVSQAMPSMKALMLGKVASAAFTRQAFAKLDLALQPELRKPLWACIMAYKALYDAMTAYTEPTASVASVASTSAGSAKDSMRQAVQSVMDRYQRLPNGTHVGTAELSAFGLQKAKQHQIAKKGVIEKWVMPKNWHSDAALAKMQTEEQKQLDKAAAKAAKAKAKARAAKDAKAIASLSDAILAKEGATE